MRYAALVAVLATACFKPPDIDDGLFCDTDYDNACPEGQTCGPDGICRWGDDDSDAGADSDAGVGSDAGGGPDAGGGGCGSINCGDPGGGDFVSLCGQVLDVETNDPIRSADATGLPCDPLNSTADGPCALKVDFFDALAFVADPTNTEPLAADLVEINDCGHFKGIRVTRPFSGMLAIAFDDSDGAGAPDVKLLTGIALSVAMGETRKDLRAFVIATTTDQGWTDSAGDPFGGVTFVEKGVYAPVFCAPTCATGTPAAGVQVTRGGSVVAGDDFYFSDTDASTRTTVDPAQDSTGANGAALMVNSGLSQHSGQGGESSGCAWESELASSVVAALLFRESFSHLPGDQETLCPE